MHDHSTADLHIISLLQDQSTCTIDGGVDLHPKVKKVSGHLLEENIILGEQVKIKTLPMLDVRSSDVSASHGARIERLDEKKLFYLKSRGLDSTQAKELMIRGYFEQVFTPFKHEQENLDIYRLEQERLDYLLS
jgi:Fe-S cluster assembly protein SufD